MKLHVETATQSHLSASPLADAAAAVEASVENDAPEASAAPAAAFDPATLRFESVRRRPAAPPPAHREARGDGAPPEGPADEPPPRAVFVAHGMGQQLSFSTLEQTAQGMADALVRRGVAADDVSLTARIRRLGEARTPAVELRVTAPAGDPPLPAVHLFEGYWAPLTEGQVTLRDVMRFLTVAAWNGLRKGVGQPLERYLFGHTALHSVPGATFVGLLVTALALGSLVLLNAVIAGVVVDAGYDVFTDGAVGQAGVVPRALTTVAFLYLVVTAAFGGLVALAALTAGTTHRAGATTAGREAFLWVVQAAFAAWVLATLAAGLLTLAVLLFASGAALPGPSALAGGLAVAAAVAVGAGAASAAHGRGLMARYREHVAASQAPGGPPLEDVAERPLSGGRLLAVTVCVVGGVVVALASAVALLARETDTLAGLLGWTGSGAFRVVVWALLFAVSGAIRNLLVQYFGDVAAYVSPHTLDRFAELRRAIRTRSVDVLRGVYQAVDDAGGPLYDGVAVVGHSLGSVVAYDALNRVLTEDAAVASDGKAGLGVRERTRLLLTFGSPLDKTAYIFRAQNQSLSKVREALANAVQPLILKEGIRTFPWVNVHAPRDVIGSALDLYDLPHVKDAQRAHLAAAGPGGADRFDGELARAAVTHDGAHCPLCVHDVEDPAARVPLVAHNEHWQTRAVFDVLVAAILTPDGVSAAATHAAATAAEAG